jgi:hypothetical protein
VIDEIGGEEIFEYLKVPAALILLGIATNDSDSGFR